MRVPIHPDDLVAGTGFIRLARTLKRDWLGIEPISLSQASELMSRCLGYSNLHDLKRDAKQGSAEFVPLASVMTQCLATMTASLMESGKCRMLNIGELQEQIFQWPFLQLTTYRNHYGHTDNRMVGQAVKTELIDAYLDTLPTRPKQQLPAAGAPFTTRELHAMAGYLPLHETLDYLSVTSGQCLHGEDGSPMQHVDCLICKPLMH
ncbi:hypothetical protein ALO95_200184 [Pseudomonas syringae pv. antirrhini]|uniref:hypothetical protein n=1 Tax=Pseudomonas TaxID=286 RepID=UPI00070F7AE1|nr:MULTISPECIES: hypothetical protein [Pseudomonas]RMW23476.1 hypothetical protein ALO95_200184 [Pseudomonas syringae pv. antirrhini]WIN08805.1 hypothetical protein QQF68_08170 [Pseudomonas syringae pv. antirrhini str. 126]